MPVVIKGGSCSKCLELRFNLESEWYENGIDKGEMTRFSGYDPAIYEYCEKNSSTFKHKYLGADITEHLFYAVPETKDSEIRVEVTDHCGNVYTRKMQQSK